MEKGYLYTGCDEYPYTGHDGQRPWSPKRPWEMADSSQSGLAGQWQDKQHQGKRPRLPGSFGDTNTQEQMTSVIPPLLSNSAPAPPSLVEWSVGCPDLPAISNLLWSNNDSGTPPLNSQLSPDPWGDRFLQPASFFPPSSGTVNSPKDLWTFADSTKTLERFAGRSTADSMPYPGRSMSGDPVHYPGKPQTPLMHLDFPVTDFVGLPNSTGHWNQDSKLGHDLPLVPVNLPGIASFNFPIGMGSWSQLNAQTPELQLRPTGITPPDPFDIPSEAVLSDQDRPPNGNLLQDTTIWIDEHCTGGETSGALPLQSQQLGSLGGNFTPSPISDGCSRTSYERGQNGVPEGATTALVDDSKYLSRAESPLSTQPEKATLETGLAEEYPFQPQLAQNQEAFDGTLSERIEEVKEVGYDTCFGMVRLV